MKPSRWLPGLRALLTIGRELRLSRLALQSIAATLDQQYRGVAPAAAVIPEPPDEPLEVAQGSPLDYERGYHVEQRLARQLGRTPSAEEICQEIDGLEWDPAQPTVVVGRRQPERTRVN